MENMYVIDINNQTGDFQQYSLIAALPKVTGPSLQKFGQAFWQLLEIPMARLLSGVGVNVSVKKPVDLGKSIEMSVRDGRPHFAEAMTVRAISGELNRWSWSAPIRWRRRGQRLYWLFRSIHTSTQSVV
ncbi:uncharacterized protein FFB14_11406 [Fusarium fujikuroi]|nr:uncharacterized protein FFB14_11406 [Fusarium fujikuroi]